MHRGDAHTQVVLRSTWKHRPVASHWDKSLLEALMQGGGDVVDLDGAVVGRGGIKPKGVAHDVKLGSLERPLMWRWWRRFSRRLLQP